MFKENQILDDEIIFKEDKDGITDLILGLLISIVFLIPFLIIVKNIYLNIILLSIIILFFRKAYNWKFNYVITRTGITFYNIISNKKISRVENIDILQIRFEDGFSTGVGSSNKDQIFLYLKKNIKSQPNIHVNKSGYISLMIGGKKENEIIEILNHFQENEVDVKIKTRNSKIKNETGLSNWDLS